jgi:hypothetical protein
MSTYKRKTSKEFKGSLKLLVYVTPTKIWPIWLSLLEYLLTKKTSQKQNNLLYT